MISTAGRIERAAPAPSSLQIADVEQRKSNEMVGAELGYRYLGSPIICNEAGDGPEHQLLQYVPSSWPGTRLPHVWLRDGSALHDKLGQG